MNEYNTAQFDLYRALGQPAQWVTSLKWQPPEPPERSQPARSTRARRMPQPRTHPTRR